MKKILIATTALVATAGAASADISLSGDARFGVLYNANGDLTFTSRTRAAINLSGESDGGLSFGGKFDIHNSENATKGFSGSVYVSGAFGKISMGDVDGAAKAAVGQIDGISLTGISDAREIFYVNGGSDADGDGIQDTIYPKPAALYEYSTGAFTFYAGAGAPGGQFTKYDGGDFNLANDTYVYADQTYSVGAKWGDNGYSVAIGWETTDAAVSFDSGTTINDLGTISQFVIGGSAEFGDFTVKANYGTVNTGSSQYGISGSYGMDALTVTGFYHHVDYASGVIKGDTYGLGASYDLGGGLSIKGGIVQIDSAATVADFGLSMSF
ncbi:MAG: porin [Paracoccaceae bacterium]